MSTSRLAALLDDAGDRVVAFGRDGRTQRLVELAAAAACVETALRASPGERWALNLDDTWQFTAALLGAWGAGKTPVLAPATMLGATPAIALDGVVEPAGELTAAPRRVVWQDLRAADRPLGRIPLAAGLVLYTSGSTGVPKEVSRRLMNMESELAALESVWGGRVGAGRVYSTVSHRHVYGLLFRVLWPLLGRRPFATFNFEYPEQLQGEIGEGNALVSSPALLKRIGHLPASSGRWRAVFSSGGVLPPEAAADARRVLGADTAEVLGSTETSGVAWRTAGSPAFSTLPSVEVRASADELLEVRSPFSGHDGWLVMGDRVAFRADGRFELLGRADRVAKIEDKRVSLTEIERHLAAHRYVKDVAAIALDAGSRQRIGVVIELTDSGRAAIAEQGRSAVSAELKASLRGRVDAIALPRVFRYPETIPVDAQGKRQVAKLTELFARRS
jgi:acyl-coenzyme A synthetase/AMP-(fatty) acid ligase